MIAKTAQIGENAHIGSHVVIEDNVQIGNNVIIGHHVVIKQDTIIDDHVVIADFTLLGKTPAANQNMARKPTQQIPPLIIEKNATIGSHNVIYRGITISEGVLIGDLASIRENVTIGQNSIVGRGAIVENNTRIGDMVTIQTSSYITANMIIEDHVFIGPCFSSSNDKYMGEGNVELKGPILKHHAKIGNNASLLPGVIINEYAVVGAGAVVTKDVKPYTTVVGNPAKWLKDND